MQGIISGCKTCLPAFVFFFFLIGGLAFLIYLAKKKPDTFKCVIITSIIVITGTLTFEHIIFPRVKKIIFRRKQPVAREEWMIYDTDPRNDEFIKGRLTIRELKQLDAVLLKEKSNDGMAFDNTTLQEIARYDPKIIDAYWRWRKCKDMRRSYHKTIYPDERQLYHYLR